MPSDSHLERLRQQIRRRRRAATSTIRNSPGSAATQFKGDDKRIWPFTDPATLRGRAVPARCRRPAGFRRPRRGARSACRWTLASPTGPAPASGRARCGPSSASAPTSMCCAACRSPRPGWPMSATCRCARASASTSAMPISRPSIAASSGRRRAGLGRRRPFDHRFDPQGARRRAAGRHDPYRRPLRHVGHLRGLEVPPRRAVPRRPCWTACSTRARTIQIGIRGGAEYLWEFSYDSGMTVIHAEEVDRRSAAGDHRAAPGRSSATARPMSRSMSTASTRASRPAPARPEVGGLTPREVLRAAARPQRPRHRGRRRGRGRPAI